MDLAESGSVDRSLLKGEVLRFSTDFTHTLSSGRLKFLRHLVGPVGIDNLIAISGRNIHSSIFNFTSTRTPTRTQTWNWNWNWNTFVRYMYIAVVPIAPYGLPVIHHGASSNSPKNLWHPFLITQSFKIS
jgi:hypothetical protein